MGRERPPWLKEAYLEPLQNTHLTQRDQPLAVGTFTGRSARLRFRQ